MVVALLGIDADEDLSRFAPLIASKGISFINPYTKFLTSELVANYHAAGLKIGPVYFELTATRALEGGGAGSSDAGRALRSMTAACAPSYAAVCMTVDDDVNADNLYQVEDYFYAADAILYGHFQIAGYADGTALSGLRQNGLPICILAGAMGWDGSQLFLKDGNPDIVQGPTVSANTTATFLGHSFPALPFEYDPLVCMNENFSAWW